MEKAKVTIKDVAKRANVSTATVSHVLNKTHFVSEENSLRVMEAVRELNFNINHFAQALKSHRSYTIGVIVPDIVSPFYSKVIYSLEESISKMGYHIILAHSHNKQDLEMEQIARMRSWQVEAIVLAPSSPTYDYADMIHSTGCPVVFLDRQPKTERYSGVFCSTRGTIRRAVEEMILSGHQRIACLLGPQVFPVAQERKNGFTEAFEARGLALPPEMVVSSAATIDNGYKMMDHVIRTLHATAVFIGNRKLTIGALQYLASHEVQIPGQMAIIGFAAYDWDKICNPPLTMVMEPLESLGVETSNLLLSLLKNPEQEPRRIFLDAHLTPRTSY